MQDECRTSHPTVSTVVRDPALWDISHSVIALLMVFWERLGVWDISVHSSVDRSFSFH